MRSRPLVAEFAGDEGHEKTRSLEGYSSEDMEKMPGGYLWRITAARLDRSCGLVGRAKYTTLVLEVVRNLLQILECSEDLIECQTVRGTTAVAFRPVREKLRAHNSGWGAPR